VLSKLISFAHFADISQRGEGRAGIANGWMKKISRGAVFGSKDNHVVAVKYSSPAFSYHIWPKLAAACV